MKIKNEISILPKASHKGEDLSFKMLEDCGVNQQVLCNEIVDGVIYSCQTNEHIIISILNLQVYQDIKIELPTAQNVDLCLNVFFNSGNSLEILSGKDNIQAKLEESSLNLLLTNKNIKLKIASSERIKIVFIQADFKKIIYEYFCNVISLPKHLENALKGDTIEKLQKKYISKDMSEILLKCFSMTNDNIERRMCIEAYSKELTAMVISTIGRNKKTYHSGEKLLSAKDKEAIHKVADILEKNFINPPVQKELAKAVGLNINKLCKGFKDVFGQTINNYVIKLKMEKAKSILLGESEITVAEVSDRVGYNNPSYFIKKFKETYNVTPGEYL